jgi:hypothetical protein
MKYIPYCFQYSYHKAQQISDGRGAGAGCGPTLIHTDTTDVHVLW